MDSLEGSLTPSTRIGRRRSSSSVRFGTSVAVIAVSPCVTRDSCSVADDTDTGTDILMITEDDLADMLLEPMCPSGSHEQPRSLPDAAYAALPAPIAQHRRMVSGRRSLISCSVHRQLKHGVYGMSVGAAGPDTLGASRMLVTLRRRKSSYAALTPDTESAPLLDSSYNRVVERFLDSCSSWRFSSFTLNALTGGHSLSNLLLYLFKSYDLIRTFRLDLMRLVKCFSE